MDYIIKKIKATLIAGTALFIGILFIQYVIWDRVPGLPVFKVNGYSISQSVDWFIHSEKEYTRFERSNSSYMVDGFLILPSLWCTTRNSEEVFKLSVIAYSSQSKKKLKVDAVEILDNENNQIYYTDVVSQFDDKCGTDFNYANIQEAFVDFLSMSTLEPSNHKRYRMCIYGQSDEEKYELFYDIECRIYMHVVYPT